MRTIICAIMCLFIGGCDLTETETETDSGPPIPNPATTPDACQPPPPLGKVPCVLDADCPIPPADTCFLKSCYSDGFCRWTPNRVGETGECVGGLYCRENGACCPR
jgi:hypothetical protein